MNRKPARVAFLSVISNFTVFCLKLFAGILTGSVAIMAEAIHSILDIVASFIAFVSVKISGKPADKSHPYGHKKVENIAGTIETLLIFVAGIWIIIESFDKLFNPEPLNWPVTGILIILFSALINLIVGRLVGKVAKETDSVAMKSNAFHLLTDVYTTLGVAAGLLIVHLTGWYFLDAFIGIGLAIYIMYEAFGLLKESFPPLIDASLPKEEEATIAAMIEEFADESIEVHDLRTRKSGSTQFIDFHLVVSSDERIGDVHALCDRIEARILEKYNRAEIFIHPEPESEKHFT